MVPGLEKVWSVSMRVQRARGSHGDMRRPHEPAVRGAALPTGAVLQRKVGCSRKRSAYHLPLGHRDGHHTEDDVERTESSRQEQRAERANARVASVTYRLWRQWLWVEAAGCGGGL
jgi:hypothetical protein